MDAAKKLAELTPHIMNAFHDLGRQPSATHEKISMRQYQTLIILHANQTLTLSQLCEKLHLAPSTGTELVNRLITLGLIEKSATSQDQRLVQLSISPPGLQFLKTRQQMLVEMFTQFLTPFPPEAQTAFVQHFEKIWELIEQYHPPPG
ncbi:MarR family winged helix-turn-helix transcriptional regulator [candidate division KSB1 bacterium]|nr:MarR family winged helix-turn-helix transcriptional regulator [candidate division KSB1 bacterium]